MNLRSNILKLPLRNRYLFLRHGQTDGNQKGIYMGQTTDSSLNEAGRSQAKKVVINSKIDVAISSPLKRAFQTAEIVLADGSHTTRLDKRLLEKDGGKIEGMTYEDIKKTYPEVWDIWSVKELEDIIAVKFPGGECDQDVVDRVENLIVELEAAHDDKTILFSTHSGVLQAARYLFGRPEKEIFLEKIPNCWIDSY